MRGQVLRLTTGLICRLAGLPQHGTAMLVSSHSACGSNHTGLGMQDQVTAYMVQLINQINKAAADGFARQLCLVACTVSWPDHTGGSAARKVQSWWQQVCYCDEMHDRNW